MSTQQKQKNRPPEKFRLPLDKDGNVIIPKDKDGNPDYGAVMRYFRLFVKGWSARYLAIRYTEVLREQGEDEDEAVTPRWIQLMEKENQVPKDPKRRWILAMLLGIPAASFGLKELNQPPKALTKVMHLILRRDEVDLGEYRLTLERYCTSYHLGKSVEIIQDVHRRVDTLRKEAHLTPSPEKEEMLRLLCEYYILAANIAIEYQYFDEAIGLLDRVAFIATATENTFYPHLAYALRQRGVLYSIRGQITAFVCSFEAAKPDFDAAVNSFDQIKEFETHLSAQRQGMIAVAAGPAYARVMLNDQDHTRALKEIDKAVAAIGKQEDDIIGATVLDAERCHIDRADIYLASSVDALRLPQTAREKELEKATRQTKARFKIRHSENAFLQAKSYFVEEEYAMATTYAELAIPFAREANSPIDFARLGALYQGLLKSPFGKSDAVAELGIKLLKAQKPYLFT